VSTTAPPDSVTLTINGQQLVAPKGMLLVEAAKLVGIDIPIFCYEPRLKPVGACRMCLVQIEKLPRLQTACTTPVAADMVVHTNTPEVIAAQNGVLELLLANHPLDCPICDKGGECPLQDNTFRYGPGASRFTEQKRHKEKAFPLGPNIVLDRERCIMCYRCVRFHQEIPGDEALAAVQRGADSEIATLDGEPYDSIFAGNTIELCPVGALTSRQYRFKARPWDLVRTPSICSGCAVGCNIEVHSRTETVLRLVSRANPHIDGGWLCDRGRFETVPMAQNCRPDRPLVRRDGSLVEVSWSEALARTAELLGAGGGILASSSLSNEALWLVQRVAQRLPAALWPRAMLGSTWPVEGKIENLARCKSIVLVGLDAWTDLPILALWIRKAVLAGARLVVLGDRNGLWRTSTAWFKGDPLRAAEALASTIASGAIVGEPAGGMAPAELARAADALRGGAPAAVLAHPSLVASGRTQLEALANALGASGDTGMLGAPALAANSRGALDVAPDVARADADQVLTSKALLAIGDESWSELPAGSFARLLLASSQRLPDASRVDVFLPLAHAYERQGTITNLEGRVQRQEGGASPPPHARADWSVMGSLAQQLGLAGCPTELHSIRSLLADEHPDLAEVLREEALIARV
jgi:NADH-quinone oxidoreductase subunit G